MKRTDFSTETSIVGQDFSELIREYGGKNAGLILAERIFFDRQGYEKMP